MEPAQTSAHPEELSGLDLFAIWTRAPQLGERLDPFAFAERMAAYRLMIDATNRGGCFGSDNRANPLWGLVFQLQWQFRTGRLGSRTRDDGRIDPDAPWGFGNYALSVIPWLGAAAAGVVPTLQLAGPPGPSRFEYAATDDTGRPRVPADLREGVEDWRRYFELVTATRAGCDLEPIRLALWKAHKSCLDAVALRLAGLDPAPYSALELTFLRGWCRMVDYLWAAAWPTDFAFMVKNGADQLPERLLLDADDLRKPIDLPSKARRNVANIVALARTPGWRYAVNLALWQRAMRTRAARGQVVAMLDAVFNPGPGNAAERKRLIGYTLRPGRRR